MRELTQEQAARVVRFWMVVFGLAIVAAWGYAAKRYYAPAPAPSADVFASRDYPDRGCHAMGTDAPAMKCPPRSNVLVWGDSMAYAWMPAFDGAGQATRDACPPMIGYLPGGQPGNDLKCRAYNDVVASRAEHADTVVLVAWWMRHPDLSPLVATLERLKHVRRVLIVGPSPVMPNPVPTCIRSGSDACVVPRETFAAKAAPILAQMHAFEARYPNVEVLDVTDRFCDATTCPPVLDGVALYWDTHHVSTTAAKALHALAEARTRASRNSK